MNATPTPRHNYRLGVPAFGRWSELLNTDAAGVRWQRRRQLRWCRHRAGRLARLPPVGRADPAPARRRVPGARGVDVVETDRLGATVVDGGTRFVVWAPGCHRRRGGDRVRARHRLVASSDGRVLDDRRSRGSATASATGSSSTVAKLADPASRWQPDGVHGPSAVVDETSFRWSDDDWTGIDLADTVLYEMHIGTFTAEGTFDAAIGQLERLVALGITTIEIMPVAAFPGVRNWGYDGVFPFAVQDSYGGPEGLARFVDAAHARGPRRGARCRVQPHGARGQRAGPVRPVLHRRLPHAVGRRDERVGRRERSRPPVLHRERSRLDLRFPSRRAPARRRPRDRRPDPDHVRAGADRGRARRRWRRRTDRARHDREFGQRPSDRAVDRRARVGLRRRVERRLSTTRCELRSPATGTSTTRNYSGAADIARAWEHRWVYSGQYSAGFDRRHGAPADDVDHRRFIVFDTNHDHVGNTPAGARMLSDAPPDDPRHRLAAAAILLSPFTPMLFMGEEYGETAPFPYFIDHGDPELVEAVRRGRRREFADSVGSGEVADPGDPATFDGCRARPDDRRTRPAPARALHRVAPSPTRAPGAHRSGSTAARVDRRRRRLRGPFAPRHHRVVELQLLRRWRCNTPTPDPADAIVFDTDDERWGGPGSPTHGRPVECPPHHRLKITPSVRVATPVGVRAAQTGHVTSNPITATVVLHSRWTAPLETHTRAMNSDVGAVEDGDGERVEPSADSDRPPPATTSSSSTSTLRHVPRATRPRCRPTAARRRIASRPA